MSEHSQVSSLPPEGDSASLEERKLQLEKDKFEYEKSKSRGLGFINANLGIIVAAIVGAATSLVSYLQLEINRQSGAQQLALQKSISDAQLQLEQSKAQNAKDDDERKLQFEIARLLLEKQADINTADLKEVTYLRNIVMSALPSDIGIVITRKMADNASDDHVRSAWLDGYVKLSVSAILVSPNTPQTTITVDYMLTQFPMLASVADARTRIQDILDAAKELGVQDAEDVMLAYALNNTGYFRGMVENLNYPSANRLVMVFPHEFPTAADAAPYVHNPSLTANKVYAHKFGNVDPDDGYKYRGRGYLGTTGRSGYEQSSKLTGVDLLTDPDKLLDGKVGAKELVATLPTSTDQLRSIRLCED